MTSATRGLRATVVAATLLFYGLPAGAADKELLDMLLENGALTQAQYEQLLEKEELRSEDLRDVAVTLDAKGLRVKTADGRYAFNIGGRVQADASGHRGSLANEATNGTEIRRARFELDARFFEDYRWTGEVDFAENNVGVKDFWVGYTGLDWGNFYVGQQKQPYSLAVEMSSNDIPFIERGTDTDLIIPFIDRSIGVRGDFSGKHWYVATASRSRTTRTRRRAGGRPPDSSGHRSWTRIACSTSACGEPTAILPTTRPSCAPRRRTSRICSP